MAAEQGNAAGSVAEQLSREPYRFDFYQAVRLLERMYPAASPVGHGGANREAVEFRSTVSLAFPASDVVAIELPEAGQVPARMSVAFMGLAGASAPLPAAYTEMILRRIALRDDAAHRFLDIFAHRLISFAYRARRKHRPGLATEAPEDGPLAHRLYDIAGLRPLVAQREQRAWARTLLRYSGILAVQTRSMAGLEALLSDYFKVPVRGERLQGRWLRIEPADRTRLGARLGSNQRLGVAAVCGRRAWDQTGRITLALGGLTLERLRGFLPGGPALERLERVTRVYLRRDLEVRLRLSLEPGQKSGTRLAVAGGSRLGWTSWLRVGPSQASDAPVNVRARVAMD